MSSKTTSRKKSLAPCACCGGPKPSGQGKKYCDLCRIKRKRDAQDRAHIRERKWREQNPGSVKDYSRRYRQKKGRAPCRECLSPMPLGGVGGKLYCSLACQKLVRRRGQQGFRSQRKNELWAHKESKGCAKCGFSRHGSALDYHHPDVNKERRLTVAGWKTPQQQEEIAKCVLLCANCHRIEHASNADVFVPLN